MTGTILVIIGLILKVIVILVKTPQDSPSNLLTPIFPSTIDDKTPSSYYEDNRIYYQS